MLIGSFKSLRRHFLRGGFSIVRKGFGPNLVTNGTFSADTNWSKAAGVTISGGVVNMTAVSSSSALFQAMSVATGRTYQIDFDLVVSSGSVQFNFFSSTLGSEVNSSGHKTLTMTTTGTPNGNAGFRANTFTGTIDNLVVRQVL